MSVKKNFINKDRFKSLAKISENEEKSENIVSRFKLETDEHTIKVDIDKLENAPKDWNFYRKLPDDKFLELVESIQIKGLLHPIVVWEKEDNYMILSGHNRARAYQKLYEITNDEKYCKIPATVKKDIDDDTARQIIVDTNWIQRQLSAYERTKSILQKYVQLKQTRIKGEKTRDIVAKHLGITGRMVQNYISLNNLEKEFFDMIDEGEINIKQALIISKFSSNIQKIIIKNKDGLDFNMDLFKKISDKNDVSQILNMLTKKEKKEYITVRYKIPRDKQQEFDRLYKEFIESIR